MKKVGQFYRESLVQQVKDGVAKNDNIFLINYSKVSGIEMSDLRKNLRRTGAKVCVTKNSIARLALKEANQGTLADRVSGQTALIWGGADSSEISKVLIKFIKDAENIKIQGGLLQGRILEREDVQKLSELPSREVLLAMLLSAIQSPLTRLAGALNAKTRELISVLQQLSEKKGGK